MYCYWYSICVINAGTSIISAIQAEYRLLKNFNCVDTRMSVPVYCTFFDTKLLPKANK